MREVTWAPRALKQFNDAIKFIRKDSDQNADVVKEKILSKVEINNYKGHPRQRSIQKK